MYTATLNVLGKTHTGKGKTIQEALGNIKPGKIAGRCIVVINGREKIMSAPTIQRAYSTQGLSREVALKNLSLMFEGV